MKNPRIEFEKYIDPIVEMIEKNTRNNNDDDDKLDYKDSSFEDDIGKKNFPYLMGPQGVLPLLNSNIASKNFNFWIVHTNFRLDVEVKNLVQSVEGVESFEQISPYRWRISFGRLFDEEKIQFILKDKVTTLVRNRHIEDTCNVTPGRLNFLKEALTSQYNFWVILVKKNLHETLVGGTKEEVEKKLLEKQNGYEYTIKSWE